MSVSAAQGGSASGNANSEPAGIGSGPITFSISYFGDAFADVSGGLSTGATYLGRLGLLLDVDLDKLLGWRGAAFHASVQQIHGVPITPRNVGALNTTTGLEAEPNTRLNNLWIEQAFGPALSVRIGQFTAAQEFLVSSNAATFVNSTFGWPTISAEDLPSGGPAYPIATPGVRVTIKPDKRTTLLAAIFNGDPAGPGSGDPQQRDGDGLNSLRISGPPFMIFEAQHGLGGTADTPKTTVRFGGWVYLGQIADQRLTVSGLSILDPRGSGVGAPRRTDYEIYAIVDHMLKHSADRTLSGFARAAFSPSDRNLVDASIDAGLNLIGTFSGRKSDTLGLAFSYTHISTGPRAFSGVPVPSRDAEAVVELTYSAMLGKSWSIQPDVQYIVHPDLCLTGGTGTECSRAGPTPNAFVAGVRNVLHF